MVSSKNPNNLASIPRNNTGTSRDNNVNILRFIAASMVIYAHMATLLGLEKTSVMGQDLGYIAVNIFFILSGYLITGSWHRSASFTDYFIRRIMRIFPALIVVIFLSTFVLGPLVTTLSLNEYFSSSNTWRYLLLIVLAPIKNELPGVFESLPYPNAVNGSLWTLRYEFLAYIVTPLFVMLIDKTCGTDQRKKNRVLNALLAIFLFCHFSVRANLAHVNIAFEELFRLAFYYLIGLWAYELAIIENANAQWAAIALLISVIFSAEHGFLADLVMSAIVVIFTLNFAFCKNSIFSNCFRVNDFSYGIYIYAFPIQQSLVLAGGQNLPYSLLTCTLVSFLLTLLFAMLSWFLIEKPCIALGKRLAKSFTAHEK